MSGGALPAVGRTAVLVAGMRAAESERADRLFDDRLAAAFVAAVGSEAALAAAMPIGAGDLLAVRTRFSDDEVMAACAAGVRQVVLLAAGLDCRAFRLEWPEDTRLWELDIPETFAFKESVLASAGAVAGCVRTVVAVDLGEPWADALTAAGFDHEAATAWLAEGLLPYMDHAQGSQLLATITQLSAPGSRMVFDYFEATADEQPVLRAATAAVRRIGAPIQPTEGNPAGWLAAHGWQASSRRMPELLEHFGRPLPAGADPRAGDAAVVVAASR